mmetsp:Transcript_8576/g.22044  ORF Transcript_8576/g.22044 Transcript_8576/m.22044 type:complete len:210 (+) Transcript_8576:429-1058(+)
MACGTYSRSAQPHTRRYWRSTGVIRDPYSCLKVTVCRWLGGMRACGGGAFSIPKISSSASDVSLSSSASSRWPDRKLAGAMKDVPVNSSSLRQQSAERSSTDEEVRGSRSDPGSIAFFAPFPLKSSSGSSGTFTPWYFRTRSLRSCSRTFRSEAPLKRRRPTSSTSSVPPSGARAVRPQTDGSSSHMVWNDSCSFSCRRPRQAPMPRRS